MTVASVHRPESVFHSTAQVELQNFEEMNYKYNDILKTFLRKGKRIIISVSLKQGHV
jgi:hypothetical protein